jgi:hypothetical protein
MFYFIVLFCLLQKIQFYTDVEQIAAIGIQCAESGHTTECSYVLVSKLVCLIRKLIQITKNHMILYTYHMTIFEK